MCVGCLVGACTLLVTWGAGQLIAWRATAKRTAAMAQAACEIELTQSPGRREVHTRRT